MNRKGKKKWPSSKQPVTIFFFPSIVCNVVFVEKDLYNSYRLTSLFTICKLSELNFIKEICNTIENR